MCDPDNWEEYKAGPANYAVGGPTIDLFIVSWNKKSQNMNVQLLDEDIERTGTPNTKPSYLRDNLPIKTNISNGLYNPGENYWLASPGSNVSWSNVDGGLVRCVDSKSHIGSDVYNCNRQSIRPIVSIPTSKINIDDDKVTVNQ